MAEKGIDISEYHHDDYLFVVVHVDIHYRKPARLGQTIEVTTEVIEMTHVTISLKHQVFLEGELLVESTVKLACINSEGRPQRLPGEFEKLRNEHKKP